MPLTDPILARGTRLASTLTATSVLTCSLRHGDVMNSTGALAEPATSCAWQQTLAADGSCAVEPRSCSDCLNQRLASGEECVLTPVGLCAAISQYDYTQDFRRSGPAGGPAAGFPVHYNYFPSANATYCATSDTLCRTCQQTAFTYDDHNPSTYCTGSEGCVCVKACEAPSWRNDTLERLRNSTEIAANASCPVALNVSTTFTVADSSSADSTDLSPTLTNATVRKNVYANEDECRWYQNQSFCDVPRSCFDCLNVRLYSGQVRVLEPPLGVASLSTDSWYQLMDTAVYHQSARDLRAHGRVQLHVRLPRAAVAERSALLPVDERHVLRRKRRCLLAVQSRVVPRVRERRSEPDAVLRGRERLRVRRYL